MVIVGGGRVGSALAARARRVGAPVSVVRRGDPWPADPPGTPVLVAVRTDELEALIPAVPDERRADLVLAQNGALRDWLAARGWGDLTRGALYLLATGSGEGEPGAVSPFAGPHAEAVVRWLEAVGVPSRVVSREAFVSEELEKLVWLAANGPLCERYGVPVGAIATDHRPEHDALVRELLAVGRAAWGAAPDPDAACARLAAYSRAIPDCRVSVKESRWRNGWFVEQAARYGVPTPAHDALMR